MIFKCPRCGSPIVNEYFDTSGQHWHCNNCGRNSHSYTVETTCPHCDSGYAQGYSDGYLRGKEERPQGEWIVFYTPKKKKVFKCDKCMAVSIQGQTNYCPNCGTDMRKGGAV